MKPEKTRKTPYFGREGYLYNTTKGGKRRGRT